MQVALQSVCVHNTHLGGIILVESRCDIHTLLKTTHAKPGKNLIGKAIRRLRLSQRVPVSQEDLAGRLAAQGITIDRSAIARIEQERRYVLDYEAVAIAKAFRVPISKLFET